MSKPGCAIIDQYDGVYYGVLKISGKEISSTFLPFKDEEKALELYTHLVAHQDDRILCCHHLVRYQDEWKYMSPAFLLDAPLFWRPVDKFHFIINLDHILKRREIQLQRLEKCLRNWQKKYSCNWVLEVNCDPVFKSIYEHKNSSSPTSAYTSASYVSMVWYCSNVYHHYNDYATQKISIINIENELSRLLPELYLHLFEGLILYAKKTKSRERVFSKSIISEDI
ncbi:uncharacterized protein [Gossypium hirsutum]|uniref:Uncharacterized protein n=1 Tax=Gossypium hirsutum TaxID=3635 RepID=A0ABM3A889_GOSHI|nr:uncharacterized protein LOC107901443 [Gossypium hirsutum]XP_040951060.1 uncharacterized protein LOC107901443 [Gossypium hirsutum]